MVSTRAAALLLLAHARFWLLAAAATVNFDWNITWVTANPDGAHPRPVMGINGVWPLPLLNLTRGDRVVAVVHNQLGNASTSMHWHGLWQNGTAHMDGPVGVSQCDIPPGQSFVYNFTLEQSGTYWYHSHSRGQYPDGLRQMMVINEPRHPYAGQFDEELTLTLSDWYHDQMPGLVASFISVENPTGAEPVPDAALLNDTQNLTIAVQPGKTYLLHLANVGAFAGQYFWIEGHDMRIVEVDGVFVNATNAGMLYLTAAQRYSVLITTKSDTSANFAVGASMDTDLFDTLPPSLNYNSTGWLVYNSNAPLPTVAAIDKFEPFDDFALTPLDGTPLLANVDQSVELTMSMINLNDGANYAAFNNVPYTTPKVPTLYTVMSSGAAAGNVSIYGDYTNSFVLSRGQTVQIVLNNQDSGKHPFHLHGHDFQTVVRGPENAGDYDPKNHTDFPAVPMRRDVVMVHPMSNIVLRFTADNPGVWLFHCHIQWHMDSGLAATMIEAPLALQKSLAIPANHYAACQAATPPVPTAGNAAGNAVDLFDLREQNAPPGPIPDGFTARGIVALVFSIISALLGLAVISWYGAAPLTANEASTFQQTATQAERDE